jgi:hypothetical protein
MRPSRPFFAVLACLALSSCFGRATYRWTEEVLLHDGRMILVERSVRTGEVPVEIGQPPGESDYKLTFNTPDGKTITWESGKAFRPFILDFYGGETYLVARGATGPDYEKHGCPKPPYFFFRWTGSEWRRIEYEQFPKEIRKRNLSASVTGDEDAFAAAKRGRLTAEDVTRSHRWLSPYYKEVMEDAPNPCATWADDHRYQGKK